MATVRSRQYNDNQPYHIDGISVRVREDGVKEYLRWHGLQIESDRRVFGARAYSTGDIIYTDGAKAVAVLPKTVLTKRLLDQFADRLEEFFAASKRESSQAQPTPQTATHGV